MSEMWGGGFRKVIIKGARPEPLHEMLGFVRFQLIQPRRAARPT